MQALHHPHIVRVLDGPAEDNGFHYFVMDYLPGGDLFHAVSTKKLDRAAALRALLQVAEALEYAHKRGLVHRDVKPQNILLDEQGAALLTDFDLVWAPDTTGGTSTGFLGTHVYVAPEQAENAKVSDARADIYSLGMTVLFVLHGRSLPQAAVYQRADFIAKLGCSQRAGVLLRHATAIELEKRLDKMGRFRKLLSLAFSDSLSPPPPPDPPVPQPPPIAEQKPPPENQPAASQSRALPSPSRLGRIRIGIFAAALLIGGPGLQWAHRSLPLRRALAGWIPSAKVPQDEEVDLQLRALKEQCDKRQWVSVLAGLDELRARFGTTPLPAQGRAIDSLREKALREQPQQALFEKLAAASVKPNVGEVIRLYGLLPSMSVYQPLAKPYLDAAVKRYVEVNLTLAENLRHGGLCAEARAGVEKVLKVVPGNPMAALALAKECDPSVAKEPEPSPGSWSLAPDDLPRGKSNQTVPQPARVRRHRADKSSTPPTMPENPHSGDSKKKGHKGDRPSKEGKEKDSQNSSSKEKEQEIPAPNIPKPEPVKKAKSDDLDQLLDSASRGTINRELENVNVGSCKGEGAWGTYIVKLTINRYGKVSDVTMVSGGDGKDCVARAIKDAHFSEFSGDPMSFTHEFTVR